MATIRKCFVMVAALGMLAMLAASVQAFEISDFANIPPGVTITPCVPGTGDNITSPPVLTYPVTDPVTGDTNCLQMNWVPSPYEEEEARAGWRLTFLTDPDIRNWVLTMAITPPGVPWNNPAVKGPMGGMSHVEVRVMDNAKPAKCVGGWGFNTDESWANQFGAASYIPLGNDANAAGKAVAWAGVFAPPWAGVAAAPPWASLACNFKQVVSINLGNGPVAGSATIFSPIGPLTGPNYLIAGDPNNGGLANASALEFWEDGQKAGTINVPLLGPAGVSNYWNNITLTPEPSTIVLLGMGAVSALGYGCYRRRRLA